MFYFLFFNNTFNLQNNYDCAKKLVFGWILFKYILPVIILYKNNANF
jgi:hypothetical protein